MEKSRLNMKCAVPVAIVALAIMLAVPSFGAVDKQITLDLNNIPIQSALTMLFQGTGLSWAPLAGVSGNVTIALRDVPFEQALKSTLNAANLTYKLQDGVYSIGLKSVIDAPAPALAPAPEIGPPPTVELPSSEIHIEKIKLTFVDCYDIAALFGVQQTSTSRASSLLGVGTGFGFGSGAGGSFSMPGFSNYGGNSRYPGSYGGGGYGNSGGLGYGSYGGMGMNGGGGYGSGYYNGVR